MKPVVLHVVEAVEAGVIRHVVDVVRHADDVVHEVALPSRRAGWDTDERAAGLLVEAGATLHTVEMRRSPARPHNARALVQLARLVRSRRPTVVHCHSSIGGALGRLAAWGTPARRVYTPNGVNTAGAIIAIERRLGALTDRLIAVSDSEAEVVTGLGLVPADRIEVIVNGIDIAPPASAPDLRRQLGLAPGTPLVGTIGRLVPQKAPDEFVRTGAVVGASRPDVHFVHIGTGPLRELVETEVRQHGLEQRWHAMGSVPNAPALLEQLDVFVLTSRFEGCPYSALEAMRAGTAVALSDVAGNTDVVEHDRSGLLGHGTAGMADAIGRLLDDGDLRTRIGEAGRRRLIERFDVADMGLRLNDLYVRLARLT